MLTALGGEKSLYRPLIFNKLTALGTLSIHGHKVCRLLGQFVSLPRLCPSHLPPPPVPPKVSLGLTLNP
jgi:hypothetical protein